MSKLQILSVVLLLYTQLSIYALDPVLDPELEERKRKITPSEKDMAKYITGKRLARSDSFDNLPQHVKDDIENNTNAFNTNITLPQNSN